MTKFKKKKFILKEYSKKVIDAILTKFKKQDSDLLDEDILPYIERFEQIKDSPNLEKRAPKYLRDEEGNPKKQLFKDILQYKTFRDLEQTVDSFPASETQQKAVKNTAVVEGDNELIYNENNIEIYNCKTHKACIVNGNRPTDSGAPLYFCISDPKSSQYASYSTGENPRSFYFVFDRSIPLSRNNKTSVIVIHVYNKTKTKNDSFIGTNTGKSIKYTVTYASNDIEHGFETIDQLITDVSKYGGSKNLINALTVNKHKFVYQPRGTAELEIFALKRGIHSLEDWNQLSYNTKIFYIGQKTVNKDIFDHGMDNELRNTYVNVGHKIPFSWLEQHPNLQKRYATLCVRKGHIMPKELFKYCSREDLDTYFDFITTPVNRNGGDDNFAEYITFDHIQQFWPNKISYYIEEQSKEDFLIFDEASEKYLPADIKNKYIKYFKPFIKSFLKTQTLVDSYGLESTWWDIDLNKCPVTTKNYQKLSDSDKLAVQKLIAYSIKYKKPDLLDEAYFDTSFVKAIKSKLNIDDIENDTMELSESIKNIIKEAITKIAGVNTPIKNFKQASKDVDLKKDDDSEEIVNESEDSEDIMQKILNRYKENSDVTELKETIKYLIKSKYNL